MKRQMQIMMYRLAAWLGIFRLFYWINQHKKIVLTYHNVIPDTLFDNSLHLGVSHSQSVFEKQVKWLKKRFGVSTSRYLVTFDDGYQNQIVVAADILNKHGIKGVFFISFHAMLTHQTLMIDKLLWWLSYVPAGDYTLFHQQWSVDDRHRQAVFTAIYALLIEEPRWWHEMEQQIEQAYPFQQLPGNASLQYLRLQPVQPEDLLDLSRHGHQIGAHSMDHRPLATLSRDDQQHDFALSMQYARQYCNTMLYSYPFGGLAEVSAQTARLCEEAGFTAAYMNMADKPDWQDVNENFVLQRISLPNESNRYLIDAKLSGFEAWCKKTLAIFRIYKLRLRTEC